MAAGGEEERSEGSADPALVAEARVDVLRALGSLTPEQRQAVVLVDFVGMSSVEAGRLIGANDSSIRGRLQRVAKA